MTTPYIRDVVEYHEGTTYRKKRRRQQGLQQQNDRVSPLGYNCQYSETLSLEQWLPPSGGSGPRWTHCDTTGLNQTPGDPAYQYLRNRVYERLMGKIRDGDSAGLGVTFAQWRQAVDMVRKRAVQVRSTFSKTAEKTLRQHRARARRLKQNNRGMVEDISRRLDDNWLEVQFGWLPAVKSIYDSMDVMQRPIPSGQSHHASTRDAVHKALQSGGSYSTFEGVIKLNASATAEVSNPNLWLLNQLGLANPAEIAFDVLKWSFVADWLFDCQSFFTSFFDTVGLNVTNASWFELIEGVYERWSPTYTSGKTVIMRTNGLRTVGLIRPTPTLNVSANLGSSLVRAGNALALASQLMKREYRRMKAAAT